MQKGLIIALLLAVIFVVISGCTQPPICGDGVCNGNETSVTCPQDCGNPIIACTSDADCPTDISSVPYCDGNNVAVNVTDYFCKNPGTVKSSCEYNADVNIVEKCTNGCKDGVCLRNQKFNFYSDPDLNTSIIAEVPTIDGLMRFNILYGNGYYFISLGKDSHSTLEVANSQRLIYSGDGLGNMQFIVSKYDFDAFGLQGESHLLSASIDNNLVNIQNKVTGTTICRGLKKYDVCKVGKIDLNVVNIQLLANTQKITFGTNENSITDNGTLFNNLFSNAGQHLNLAYPNNASTVSLNIMPPVGQTPDSVFTASWSNGVARVSCTSGC